MIFVVFNQINKRKAKYVLTVCIPSYWILRSELNKWRITLFNHFEITKMNKKNLYVTCKSKKKARYRLTTVTRRYWAKPGANKMDETEVRTRKIETDQEKMEYINFAYNEGITYWKKQLWIGL